MALTIDCVSTLHLSTVHHGTRLGFGGPTGRPLAEVGVGHGSSQPG